MEYPRVPIKGKLYLAIERHVPSGPLPISPYLQNAFAGTMEEARRYEEQLEVLSQEQPVTCVRCRKTTAWWIVEATTLEVAGWPGGDRWAKSGPVCKRCYDELLAEAEKGASSQVVEITGPAPGYEAVNAWLLAFHATQFTPGYGRLSLKGMLDRFPWILTNSLEVVSWLKKTIRRALGAFW